MRRLGDSLGVSLAALAVVIIGVAVLVYLFSTQWALIVATLLLTFLCAVGFYYDKGPFDTTRFVISLVAAWGADKILFLFGVAYMPYAIVTLGSAVMVASVFMGYLTWRSLEPFKAKEGSSNNSMALGAGFLVALFLMFTVVGPAVKYNFPAYWHRIAPTIQDLVSGP